MKPLIWCASICLLCNPLLRCQETNQELPAKLRRAAQENDGFAVSQLANEAIAEFGIQACVRLSSSLPVATQVSDTAGIMERLMEAGSKEKLSTKPDVDGELKRIYEAVPRWKSKNIVIGTMGGRKIPDGGMLIVSKKETVASLPGLSHDAGRT
jgi:hypothetical protein